VIKGQVANLSRVEKSGIRVQATLLDNTDARPGAAGGLRGKPAVRRSDPEGGTVTPCRKRWGTGSGEGLANMNVAPNKAIPFMVVFFDAPATMDSYKLEAKDSGISPAGAGIRPRRAISFRRFPWSG